MSSEPGHVQLDGVSKSYDGESHGFRLRDAIPGSRHRFRREVIALDQVDLDIAPGETVGFVGPNGAGKSTLLKVVAGITAPTSGTVSAAGRVGSMIELGLGFHPDLTGWENIACSAAMLGLHGREIDEATPAIVDFSGIESALDEPMRTYSMGMRARLGFAVTTQIDADVLVIDEVLAVGDTEFQLKCLERIQTLAARGVTVLFVSHDMSLVRAVCERAVCVRNGRLVDDGAATDVVGRYLQRSTGSYRPSPDAPLRLERCELAPAVIDPWTPVRIVAEVVVHRPLRGVDVAVEMSRPFEMGEPPFTFATAKVGALRAPGRYRLTGQTNPYPGGSGAVLVTVSLIDAGRHEVSDREAMELTVPGQVRPRNVHLAVVPEVRIERVEPRGRDVVGAPPQHWADGACVARVHGVTKRYVRNGHGGRARLAIPGRAGHRIEREITALDRVDLDIHAGTALGVIGTNGAGKSTLLRVLGGVTAPDAGTVDTSGRVVAVLDLGLGFHPELTGRQNLEVSAELLGLPAAQLADRLDEIAEFAGLEEELDQLVEHYSTGMQARLGFALAVHTDPDVLLVDELLAVGDRDFRRLALDRIRSMRDAGVAIVVASHGLRLIEQVCDRAIRVEAGRIVDDGPARDVVERYGGSSSVSGAVDAGSAVRLHDFHLRRHHIGEGEALEFRGTIEVVTPVPTARLEVSYRASPVDRDVELTYHQVLDRTFFLHTLEPAGGALAVAGWHRFEVRIPDNHVSGAFDLVVAAFDERDQVLLSEAWQEARVGDDETALSWRCNMVWDAEPIGSEAVS